MVAEAGAAPTPANPAPANPAPATPAAAGTPDLAATIDQLSAYREAARSARPELTLRHSEFGAVHLRIDAPAAAAGEWRALLTSRDPGFVPAVQAALAERAVAASSESTAAHGGPSGGRSGDAGSSGQGSGQGSGQAHYGFSPGSGQGSSSPYLPQGSGQGRRDAAPSATAQDDPGTAGSPSGGLFA
jgi:hypothetical protein